MNEVEARAEHIDPALRAAGWGVAGIEIRAVAYGGGGGLQGAAQFKDKPKT